MTSQAVLPSAGPRRPRSRRSRVRCTAGSRRSGQRRRRASALAAVGARRASKPPLRGRLHGPTLGARRPLRHRRKGRSWLRLNADDSGSYLGRRRAGAPAVGSAHEPGLDVAREYWFELLIAFAGDRRACSSSCRTRLAGRAGHEALVLDPAVAVLVLPLFARRRFPFAAPAAYWLLAAALSFVDGLLIAFIGSLGVVGLATAFLLGNLRDSRQAGVGLVDRSRRIVIVVYNIPGHADGELVSSSPSGSWSPGSPATPCASVPSRPKRRRAARGARPSASARRRRTGRSRRGAGADRARAARHRRPCRQRDGPPGRRRPAQAARKRWRRTGRRSGASSRPAVRRSPRCAACSGRCAATATASNSRPSRASTASTRCWTTSAAPDCPSGCMSTASLSAPTRDRPLCLSDRAGRPDQRAQACGASHADVTVRYRPDELEIEVPTTATAPR